MSAIFMIDFWKSFSWFRSLNCQIWYWNKPYKYSQIAGFPIGILDLGSLCLHCMLDQPLGVEHNSFRCIDKEYNTITKWVIHILRSHIFGLFSPHLKIYCHFWTFFVIFKKLGHFLSFSGHFLNIFDPQLKIS